MRAPRHTTDFADLSTVGKVNRIIETVIALLMLTVIAISPFMGLLSIITGGPILQGVLLLVFGLLMWAILWMFPKY